jgi:hypothetical protein
MELKATAAKTQDRLFQRTGLELLGVSGRSVSDMISTILGDTTYPLLRKRRVRCVHISEDLMVEEIGEM